MKTEKTREQLEAENSKLRESLEILKDWYKKNKVQHFGNSEPVCFKIAFNALNS